MRPVIMVETLAVVLMVLLTFHPTVVNGIFMDMYDKMFQVELLDDCSVYIYDRVLFFNTSSTEWCKFKKSSFNAMFNESRLVIVAIYQDADSVVKLSFIHTPDKTENKVFLMQDFFEVTHSVVNLGTVQINVQPGSKAGPTIPSEYGRYYISKYNKNGIWIFYEACKYGKTTDKSMSRLMKYKWEHIYAVVDKKDDCDSNVIVHHALYLNDDHNVTDTYLNVFVDPAHKDERQCTIGNQKFVIHPIKQSIQTSAIAYKMIANFYQTFSPYSKQPNGYSPNFSGAKKSSDQLSFNKKSYKWPEIKNGYTQQPFLYYDAGVHTNSPLFLYYKPVGSDGTFTIRYICQDKFYDIFTPIDYMRHCKFNTSDSVTAAPRVIKEDDTLISIEVYFLKNNANFEFCIIEVEIKYSETKTKVAVMKAAKSNAYVHVETRSTTAANCVFGGRAVRWLLAYSSKEGKAELISLDDSVSSPIFPCSHCGPNTKIYCDVTPEAKKYRSSVFILTGDQVTYVRVDNAKGYELKIEYNTTKLDGEYYFVQNDNLTMEVDKMFLRLDGQVKGNGEVSNSETTNDEPRNEEYYSNWLDAANSYSPFWCLILIALIFLA